MKTIFALALAFTLSNCAQPKNTPTNQPADKQVKTVYEADYYAVNLKFTPEEVSFLSAEKMEGDLKMNIVRSTDMFLAVYDNDELVYFADFADPLNRRTLGEGSDGNETKTKEGFTSLLLPAILNDYELTKDYQIGIYKVISYIDAFTDVILSHRAMKSIPIEEAELVYEIEAKDLADFLNR